jgi:alanyl-tRNA synthetase
VTSNEIRKKFLDYFKERGHAVVPSSALIPKGDPTLLFTNAGMVQFKGVFLGEEKRDYCRAVTAQKCVRAGGKHNDLENVGRTARHHTFFEMLGNFSFGDYFKEKAIEYGWEFLTKVMGLDAGKLWVTVFLDDDEAAGIWKDRAKVQADRIVRLGEKDNFWSMGDTGPCGPCSEILIDQGKDVGCGSPDCKVGCDCDRFLELWNLVFMQFNRSADGKLTPLAKPSIDTGMGLERLTAVMQGKRSNYDSDLFTPLIGLIEELSGVKYGAGEQGDISMRAIADHARAVTFLITDGVTASNEGRGYVLRRIIRRASRRGRMLGMSEPFLHRVCGKVIGLMGDIYPETARAADVVTRAARGEEERFLETLERGLELLDAELAKLPAKGAVLSGETAFKLYDTYGFPLDLTADVARERNATVDEAGFEAAMEVQREAARKAWKGSGEVGSADAYKALAASGVKSAFVGYHLEASSSRISCILKNGARVDQVQAGDEADVVTAETPFYGESGGQKGDTGIMASDAATAVVIDVKKPSPDLIVHRVRVEKGELKTGDAVELVPDADRRQKTRRNHSATHLIHAALRKRLGEHVRQAGSLVGPEGLRFDFNHFTALTRDELLAIEADANRAVMQNVEVRTTSLPFDEAVRRGALAFFEEKYSGTVRMVEMTGLSSELCGGTHVRMTGDIGPVRITSESSVAAGVRRIEAITGEAAVLDMEATDGLIREAARLLKVAPSEVPQKISKLLSEQKELGREMAQIRSAGKKGGAEALASNAREIAGARVVVTKVDSGDAGSLREIADGLRMKLGSGVIVLGAEQDGKAVILAAVTKDLTSRFSAGEIIKALAPMVGGKGGGKPDLAQAGGKDADKLDEALQAVYGLIEKLSASAV